MLAFLLPLLPFPTLSMVASQEPQSLPFYLALYLFLPFPISLLSHWFFPRTLKRKLLNRLSPLRSHPLAPGLFALILPFLFYWSLAPRVWGLAQAYRWWLLISATGVILSLSLGFLWKPAPPPWLLSGTVFLIWSLTGRTLAKYLERVTLPKDKLG